MKASSTMNGELGKLHIVATPIGNLSDMTYRAVEILKAADLVLCEDTRTTKKLLDHYGIEARTMSYHAHSGPGKASKVVDMLREGKNLALVSDAGTPCISDPGVMLVAEVRRELGDEAVVSPVPGASALISALSASGLPAHEFTWLGFVPHKKGRETFWTTVDETEHTVVFYESVHRFMKTMESLAGKMPGRRIAVARELTKMFEEIRTGTVAEVLEHYAAHPDTVRGEFVIVVGPK